MRQPKGCPMTLSMGALDRCAGPDCEWWDGLQERCCVSVLSIGVHRQSTKGAQELRDMASRLVEALGRLGR